mgnify:CR=1 FL=1
MESLSLLDMRERSGDMFQAKKTQFMVEIRQKKRDDELNKKRLKFALKLAVIPEDKASAVINAKFELFLTLGPVLRSI